MEPIDKLVVVGSGGAYQGDSSVTSYTTVSGAGAYGTSYSGGSRWRWN